jgi:hypothetical protein
MQHECVEDASANNSSASQSSLTPEHQAARDSFCFEANDKKSLIINYCGLGSLKCHMHNDAIIDHLVACARQHMAERKTPQFIFHLFCNGMVIKDMMQHRAFMLSLASMFRDTFPTELYACYVHHAPSFFYSVYEMLHNVIPKSARDKIIMVKKSKK